MTDLITSIQDPHLPQPGTEEWQKLPEDVRGRVDLAIELREFLPDSVLPELDSRILEILLPYARKDCGPEG